jgi:hypothetical protein
LLLRIQALDQAHHDFATAGLESDEAHPHACGATRVRLVSLPHDACGSAETILGSVRDRLEAQERAAGRWARGHHEHPADSEILALRLARLDSAWFAVSNHQHKRESAFLSGFGHGGYRRQDDEGA